MVPVPADRVLEVYELLASKAPPPKPASPSTASWDEASIKRFMGLLSYRGQILVEHLAQHSERPVTLEEISGVLELDAGSRGLAQLQGLIGSVIRNRNWVSRELPDPIELAAGEGGDLLSIDPAIAELVVSVPWKRRAGIGR